MTMLTHQAITATRRLDAPRRERHADWAKLLQRFNVECEAEGAGDE